MAENCQNCNEVINGSFCSSCGQKKYKRIDKKYIWDEIQYTVLHTNKGLLYSIKSVLKNPGKTAKEFIDGNRVNHYKPILLVFVLSGLSTFLSFKVLNLKEIMTGYFTKQNLNSDLMVDIFSSFSSYNAILMLVSLPLFAITTKIAFSNWKHNFYEHIVMNAYILSFYTLISMIFVYPFMFMFRHSPDIFFRITQYSAILVPLILVWFFKGFYHDKPLKTIIIKVFLSLIFALIGFVLFIVIFSLSLAGYIKLFGTEALHYVNPH